MENYFPGKAVTITNPYCLRTYGSRLSCWRGLAADDFYWSSGCYGRSIYLEPGRSAEGKPE